MTDERKRELKRELKRCALGWSILCSAAATIGGIIGWVSWEADQER